MQYGLDKKLKKEFVKTFSHIHDICHYFNDCSDRCPFYLTCKSMKERQYLDLPSILASLEYIISIKEK